VRLRALLFVEEPARRAIARLQPNQPRTARGSMATREAVVSYLQSRLDALSALAPWWDNEPLSPVESQDASAAVAYLRSAGKSDGEIRAWLLLQRARYDVVRSNADGSAK
jgi:hypothetical protein